MTPLLAWVGLGADGLSSSCYGLEEAFLALAHHTPLALFLALATAATVFIIALGYNRGIALFPTGGGYRVATPLFVTSACASRSTATTRTRAQLAKEDELFSGKPPEVDEATVPGKPDPSQPAAVLLVGKHRGASMRVLLWVNRLFPGHFRNVIVLAVGEVDVKAYDGHEHLEQLRRAITEARQRCRASPSQRHRGRLPDRVRHEPRRRIHEPRVVDARRAPERRVLREQADLPSREFPHGLTAQPDACRVAGAPARRRQADAAAADERRSAGRAAALHVRVDATRQAPPATAPWRPSGPVMPMRTARPPQQRMMESGSCAVAPRALEEEQRGECGECQQDDAFHDCAFHGASRPRAMTHR
ncbi:hypothetical protein LGN07_03215 [Burkholderia cepacia]|uniref:hypothetical protein n=1 Tax=Burkholderia cepacia TaxID=292 RepID=UPI001CF5BEC3|nr:hypothetical protein [Burkholderia cepacia]MCA8117712.1 hypothetical protein [Burkholderia cepacia]